MRLVVWSKKLIIISVTCRKCQDNAMVRSACQVNTMDMQCQVNAIDTCQNNVMVSACHVNAMDSATDTARSIQWTVPGQYNDFSSHNYDKLYFYM